MTLILLKAVKTILKEVSFFLDPVT